MKAVSYKALCPGTPLGPAQYHVHYRKGGLPCPRITQSHLKRILRIIWQIILVREPQSLKSVQRALQSKKCLQEEKNLPSHDSDIRTGAPTLTSQDTSVYCRMQNLVANLLGISLPSNMPLLLLSLRPLQFPTEALGAIRRLIALV